MMYLCLCRRERWESLGHIVVLYCQHLLGHVHTFFMQQSFKVWRVFFGHVNARWSQWDLAKRQLCWYISKQTQDPLCIKSVICCTNHCYWLKKLINDTHPVVGIILGAVKVPLFPSCWLADVQNTVGWMFCVLSNLTNFVFFALFPCAISEFVLKPFLQSILTFSPQDKPFFSNPSWSPRPQKAMQESNVKRWNCTRPVFA